MCSIMRGFIESIVLYMVAWITHLGATGSLQYHPGHMKPFGLSGPFEVVDEIDGYPTPQNFFRDYVAFTKPLKMKNAAKLSPAYNLWTDAYFMSIESLKYSTVSVENSKIEDRQKPILSMSFHDFLEIYNASNNYLVSSVPVSISDDVFLPFPLQCPEVYEDLLLANVMWMSSGDTASVVHTDSVNNIICSYRGTKQVVLIDPEKYSSRVIMEHPDEGYSDIDVKKVNYTKYFGLANVSYYLTNITSGDCLFIPFHWIHQVVSFDSNIAVNIWWHQDDIQLDGCIPSRDYPITLNQVTFHGITSYTSNFSSELLNHFENGVTNVELYEILVDGNDLPNMPQAALKLLDQIFEIFDMDEDGIATKSEASSATTEEWSDAETYYNEFLKILENKRTKTNPKTEL